ncbi:MAG TPA: CDP-alcohol phosphatidyltransferase family protein [Polyangiales bacterium]|nr:CDP-alcohol phosphatidyltransferase family protein [Polyangiales bacterium]
MALARGDPRARLTRRRALADRAHRVYRPRVSLTLASRWNALPDGIERWSVCNALAALAGAGLSVGLRDAKPAVLVAAVALGFAFYRAAPREALIPSAITASRVALLCAALGLAAEREYWVATAALANFALDGLDGWAARQLDQSTAFGARFDMECDSHTVLLLDLHLFLHGGYPAWVLWAGALRYVYVLTRFVVGPRELRERRSNVTRWVFSLVFVSRTFACLPDMHALALPLLALATLAVTASFAPDFYALRSARAVR